MPETFESPTKINRREFLQAILKPPTRAEKAPLDSREKLIALKDRNVSIIYTDHGDNRGFPGLEQTEKDIESAFEKKPVDGIIIDGFPRLKFESPPDKPLSAIAELYDSGLQKTEPQFIEWGPVYALKNNMYLIAGDPYGYSELIIPVMASEFEKARAIRKDVQTEYDNRLSRLLESEEYRRLEMVTGIGMGLNIIFGLSMLHGFRGLLSRREFLRHTGSIVVSGALLGVINRVNALVKDGKDFLKDSFGREPWTQNFIDQMNLSIKHGTPEELEDKDSERSEVKRRAKINAEAYHIAIGFRNAMAAEACLQPLNKLFPGRKFINRKANIAQVWGWDHANVPEEMKVSYFMLHEEERRNYIRACINALEISIQQIGGDENTKDKLIRDLDRPTSYKASISLIDGSFISLVGHPFRVLQFLEQH